MCFRYKVVMSLGKRSHNCGCFVGSCLLETYNLSSPQKISSKLNILNFTCSKLMIKCLDS